MSKIKLVSVGELKSRKFIVPDYQRGYRWQAETHVSALLEDVLDFMRRASKDEKAYCLQPLVVTQKGDDWEVIDGQQRLTTLYLILKAFGSDSFDLEYETRTDTTKRFLEGLTVNSVENHNNPDFYFISKAWQFIKKWRDKMSDDDKGRFMETLEGSVNVIWYDVESSNRDENNHNLNIDIFNRLNVGKIPLTQSELVKALLLSKIKNIYKGDELTLRQSEISNEFYRMEAELRKPHKWGFLTGGTTEEDSHLDIILRLISQKDNTEQPTPYLWLERKIVGDANQAANPTKQGEAAMAFWKEIKQAFARVNAWFCETGEDATSDKTRKNAEIYHYVGYLLAAKVETIDRLYGMAEGKGRTGFAKELHDRIVADFKKAGILDGKKGFLLNKLEYGKTDETIKKLLLFLNVLTCMKMTDGQYNRFPFGRYAEKKWSIEHIYPQNPDKEVKDLIAIKAWLDETKENLDKVRYSEKGDILASLKKEVEEMLRIVTDGDISDTVVNKVKELRQNLLDLFVEEPKHDFSNLLLLSRNDNSKLNNAIFPVKRDRIIELEKEGTFIPPCTRNAFLKFYSSSGSQPYFWSKSDSDAYLQAMKELLEDFLKETTNE